jgi:hypothetical protein
VIFLDRGRIASSGRPDELAASAAAARVRLLVTHGLPQLLSQVEANGLASSHDNGSVEVEIDERHLADFLASLAAAGVRYRAISLRKPTLEDYFLKLAGAAARDHAREQAGRRDAEQDVASAASLRDSSTRAGIPGRAGEEAP